MSKFHRVVASTLLLAVLLVRGCGADPATSHPAARTIQKLLELRAKDVRDAKAYAPYFEESALATALAEESTEATGTRQVPPWKAPYVSEETTATASVVVVWEKSAAFPDWPKANIFAVALREGAWIVIDAIETTSPPEPIKRALSGSK